MSRSRRYQELAVELRALIAERGFEPGDRLLTERQIAEHFGVPRSLVREAVLTLEVDGLVSVRKGSGIYLREQSGADAGQGDDIGPFELLQARQVIESAVAEQAARTVTKSDILAMRAVLEQERRLIDGGVNDDYSNDEAFHKLIAAATQNSALSDSVQELWNKRRASPMWARLHTRINDPSYRRRWLDDHQMVLSALTQRDATAARAAMWQHLENVRNILMELSDVDDPSFDGYLFAAPDALVAAN